MLFESVGGGGGSWLPDDPVEFDPGGGGGGKGFPDAPGGGGGGPPGPFCSCVAEGGTVESEEEFSSFPLCGGGEGLEDDFPDECSVVLSN